MHSEKRSRCTFPQGWYFCIAFFITLNVNAEYIPTIINGKRVIEFGDFGKAPNQYPLTVGDLNVISSTIVTQVKGKTFVIESSKDKNESNQK